MVHAQKLVIHKVVSHRDTLEREVLNEGIDIEIRVEKYWINATLIRNETGEWYRFDKQRGWHIIPDKYCSVVKVRWEL